MNPVSSSFMLRPFIIAVISGIFLSACSADRSADAPTDAGAQEAAAQFSEPNYDADISKFMAVLEKFEDTGLFSAEERMETIRDLARNEQIHFVSALMRTVKKDNAESHALLEGITLALGYDSMTAFIGDGDAVFQALAIITFKRIEAATYKDIAGASAAGRDVWLGNSEYGAMARMIYATPDALIAQVEPHYEKLVIDRGAADPADNPKLQDFYAFLAMADQVEELIPVLSAHEQTEFNELSRRDHIYSDRIDYFTAHYPGELEMLASAVRSYGFESLEDWAATGDRIALGMGIATVKRGQPAEYEEAKTLSDEALAALPEEERMIMQLVQTLPDDEMAFFDANLDRFMEISGMSTTAQSGSSGKIADITIGEKPATRIEAIGAYLFVLPKMMAAMPKDEKTANGFTWADQSAQPVTAMLDDYLASNASKRKELQSILKSHGVFASIEAWAKIGDDFTRGMIAADMKRDNRADYDRIDSLTPEELAALPEALQPTFIYLQNLTADEKLFYDGYYDYYQELLTPYAEQ